MVDIFFKCSQLEFRQVHDFPSRLKPIFHLATLFARREAKTRIRQRDWLKLDGEKIRPEQIGSVPTFLSARVNKVAKWKIGLRLRLHGTGSAWSRNHIR